MSIQYLECIGKIVCKFEYFGRSFSFYDFEGNKIEIWEDYDYNLK